MFDNIICELTEAKPANQGLFRDRNIWIDPFGNDQRQEQGYPDYAAEGCKEDDNRTCIRHVKRDLHIYWIVGVV